MRALILVAGAALALAVTACDGSDSNEPAPDANFSAGPSEGALRVNVLGACGHVPGPRERVSGECAAALRDYREATGTDPQ